MANDALARASQRHPVSVARARGPRAPMPARQDARDERARLRSGAPDTTWQRVELAVLVGGIDLIDSRTEAELTD